MLRHIRILALILAVLTASGCVRPASSTKAVSAVKASLAVAPPTFLDVAQSAGLHYTWTIPGKRPLNILQTAGNGCAFLDYNNDGFLDILLVGPSLALYQGDGHGHFTDVTHQTGLDRLHGHFLGCAVGDYDNDGYDDLYLSGYKTGLLLHNDQGRRFTDVTAQAGLSPQPWGTSCIFFDADNDGKLDLFVGNYVKFGPDTRPQLCSLRGVLTSCGPSDYQPLRGVLYHNLGHGRFQDVTHAWGLDTMIGRTLGVAAGVYGPHFLPALALADDETPGNLFIFHGRSAEDIGTQTGVARNGAEVVGGMGIDWGDYDNDGNLDLVIATYENQGKLLMHNADGVMTTQDSYGVGLGDEGLRVAFGVKFLDVDNDGRLDLLFANGHIESNVDQIGGIGPASNFVYRQPLMLFHNVDGSRYENASAQLGSGAERSIVGRGLATGDFDNDGKIDVLVTDAEGTPLLLHNVSPSAGHWMEIKLRGSRSNRDGIGALVTVEAEGKKLLRLCTTGGSYLSASDRRVHIGLGDAKAGTVTVRWPSGTTRSYGHIAADRIVTLTE
jgi:hypothetical protein